MIVNTVRAVVGPWAGGERERYAVLALVRDAIARVLRPVASILTLSIFAGCSTTVRVDMAYNATNQGTTAAVATWRNQRLRFFHDEYADAVDNERRAYVERALRWLDQQQVFACPGEKLYMVQREEVWAVEFMERGERFTVFVGCCDGYYFANAPEGFSCTGRGDYIIVT